MALAVGSRPWHRPKIQHRLSATRRADSVATSLAQALHGTSGCLYWVVKAILVEHERAIVSFVARVTESNVIHLVRAINELQRQRFYRHVELQIASPGGQVLALQYFLEALSYWKDHGLHLNTPALTSCSSAAAPSPIASRPRMEKRVPRRSGGHSLLEAAHPRPRGNRIGKDGKRHSSRARRRLPRAGDGVALVIDPKHELGRAFRRAGPVAEGHPGLGYGLRGPALSDPMNAVRSKLAAVARYPVDPKETSLMAFRFRGSKQNWRPGRVSSFPRKPFIAEDHLAVGEGTSAADSRLRGNDGHLASRHRSSFPRKRESTINKRLWEVPYNRESTRKGTLWKVPPDMEATRESRMRGARELTQVSASLPTNAARRVRERPNRRSTASE